MSAKFVDGPLHLYNAMPVKKGLNIKDIIQQAGDKGVSVMIF